MTEVFAAVAAALLVALILIAWMLLRQIEGVKREGRDAQEAVRKELGGLQQSVATELKSVSTEVTRQLEAGMRLIASAQTTMGDRLDSAARVVGEVQGSLGKLGEATQRMVEVGKEIQGLEQILKSPKVRGGLGETLLEQLLAQMLPREHYALQHPFKSGEKVDAAIALGGRLVPVDAKFPLENFRRILAEPEEDKRRPFRKQFARDVKTRIDEIAKKYILPDEGTYDFALMYIPAENVYFEAITKDESLEEDPPAVYAASKRVIPVSPNSLYAYLRVIVLGLRGLQIERSAQEIQERLTRLGGDLDKFREAFDVVGRHLTNARNKYDEAGAALNRVEAKLEGIEKPGGQAALPGVGA